MAREAEGGGLPPGSLGLPVVGETLAWAADSFSFMEERARRFGPVFKTRLFGQKVVCCVGPEALARFFDDAVVARSGASPPHLEALIGAGTLPFVDGETQRRNKRWMLAAFDDAGIEADRRAATPIVRRAVERWEGLGSFRWFPEIEAMVLRIFATLFTGADPDADDPALRRDLDLFLAGILALPLPVPWGTYTKALRAKERLLSRLRAAVANRRAEPGTDVASRLLAARERIGGAVADELSDERVAAEMLHLLFAGYGAMAAGLAFLADALARHPATRDAVAAEARDVLGDADPTWAALGRLETTGRVWREVLRAYPIVPHTLFGRVVAVLECYGYRVPAGWKATACVQASLQSRDVYAHPERFDPDRFAADRAEAAAHPCAFVPQGGGPPDAHRCLGERTSEMVAKLVAALLRDHTWELADPAAGIDRRAFPPRPRDGLAVTFRRR